MKNFMNLFLNIILFSFLTFSIAKADSIMLSSYSFMDSGSITQTSNGAKYPTKSMNFGLSLGYGHDTDFDWTPHSGWGWNYSGGFVFGQTHLQNQNNDLNYETGGNSENGVYASVGTYIRLPSKCVRIGAHLPIYYKMAHIDDPTGYTIENKSKFMAFTVLDLSWQIFDKWIISQKIGPCLTENSTLWDISANWMF